MSAPDDPHDLDLDVLLATIYEMQTSLKMLTDQLAREYHPDLPDRAILDVAILHQSLLSHLPSLRRH